MDKAISLQTNRKFVLSLIFGLLLAQWLIFTHVHDQDSNTADSLCSVCLAGEHFNHALANNQVDIPGQAVTQFVLVLYRNLISQQFFLAFHSRAPPFFL